MKKEKMRLDNLLVEKGLAETRSKAAAMILAGQVLVGDAAAGKAGEMVPQDSVITLKETNPYVSRGGLKLRGAMEAFKIAVRGMTCLDIGASTGGFTDYLLQQGARKVYAVDVGHNQLHYRLRNDPRVVNWEGVNFRYFSCETLKENIEFVTIDVSFISLEKILPAAVGCLTAGGDILAMVKPQFEALPEETDRGVVKDESVRIKTIEKIKKASLALGLEIRGEVDSPLKGPQGNLEHFLWMRKQAL